jgi:hypothetical protein
MTGDIKYLPLLTFDFVLWLTFIGVYASRL